MRQTHPNPDTKLFMNIEPQKSTEPTKKGMNKWVVAFCWAVIFAGLYSLWRGISFSLANPAPNLFGEDRLLQFLAAAASVVLVAIGCAFGDWKGGRVAACFAAMGFIVLFALAS